MAEEEARPMDEPVEEEDERDYVASADRLTEDQESTRQDRQVEVAHPDSFARKQYEADTLNPETQVGVGNNPTPEQGGVGARTEDLVLDPSHSDEANE